MRVSDYALVIIVKDTKDFNLQELSETLARGVIKVISRLVESPTDEFTQWNSSNYRKILKRLKPKDFAKIPKDAVTFFRNDHVEIAIFDPAIKGHEHPSIKRAQVSGLTVLERTDFNFVKERPALRITTNKSLEMSPAKESVAAAHASHQAFLSVTESFKEKWANNDYALEVESSFLSDVEYDIEIHDSGFTEVEPNSITSVASWLY